MPSLLVKQHFVPDDSIDILECSWFIDLKKLLWRRSPDLCKSLTYPSSYYYPDLHY